MLLLLLLLLRMLLLLLLLLLMMLLLMMLLLLLTAPVGLHSHARDAPHRVQQLCRVSVRLVGLVCGEHHLVLVEDAVQHTKGLLVRDFLTLVQDLQGLDELLLRDQQLAVGAVGVVVVEDGGEAQGGVQQRLRVLDGLGQLVSGVEQQVAALHARGQRGASLGGEKSARLLSKREEQPIDTESE
jgi:hypothetical protein